MNIQKLKEALLWQAPKKRRYTPPLWVVVPFYFALFFREEFTEYRLNLQRQYARAKRKGARSASLYCKRAVRDWSFAAVVRIGLFLLKFVPFFKAG